MSSIRSVGSESEDRLLVQRVAFDNGMYSQVVASLSGLESSKAIANGWHKEPSQGSIIAGGHDIASTIQLAM